MILEFFPPVAPELQNEIHYHPALAAKLQSLPDETPLEQRFAVVLAYVGIQVDGEFFEEDLEKMFGLALSRLRSMRSTFIS